MKQKRRAAVGETSAVCPICGGPTNGYHFGINACRSCANFFRRTVITKHTYTCLSNSDCKLEHKNRTMCKCCRFTKCLDKGMNVKAVQKNRDPIGSKKKKLDLPSKAAETKKSLNCDTPSNEFEVLSSSKPTSLTLLQKMLDNYNEFCRSERCLYFKLHPQKLVLSVKDYTLVNFADLIRMERGMFLLSETLVTQWFSGFKTFSNIAQNELLCKFFINFVSLRKSFCTSTEYPDDNDTKVSISFGQYLDVEGLEHYYKNDLNLSKLIEAFHGVYQMIRSTSTKFTQLSVRNIEFIALSGLILCNEVSILLHQNEEIIQTQNQIIRELHDNIAQTYEQSAVGVRIGKLILLLNDCDIMRKQISEVISLCRVFAPHFIDLWEDHQT